MVAIKTDSNNSTTLDGDGLRFSRTDANGTGSFLWNGKVLEVTLGANNTMSTWYTQGMGDGGRTGVGSRGMGAYGDIVSTRDAVAGTSSLQLYDASGNVIQTTDSGGNITATIAYDAFGNVADNSGPANPTIAWQGKQGYQFEPTLGPAGLQYVRQRWYDPATRQFISPDPLGFGGGDANLFRYAGNNPVNRNDPGGEDPIYNGMDLGSTKLNPQVGTEAGDRAILNDKLKSWQKNGYAFAAALLTGFLANKNGAIYGGSTNAFNIARWQNELKNSRDYRSQAEDFLSNYVLKYVSKHSSEFVVGMAKDIPAPPPKKDHLYIKFYFDSGYGDSHKIANDLMYALGGQIFTFTGKIHVLVGKATLKWRTKDLHVTAKDDYHFPVYNRRWWSPIADAKELFAWDHQSFRAGYDLEHNFGYKPFTHSEIWHDRFSGVIRLIPVDDMSWYWDYMQDFGHP